MTGEEIKTAGVKCPKCNHELDSVLSESIRVLDGNCPSSCDDAVVISVRCPYCGFRIFSKTVAQEYATWALDQYPDWVETGWIDELNPDEKLDEDLYIFPKDGKLFLAERRRIISSGEPGTEPELPAGSDLWIEKCTDGRWLLVQPERVLAEITNLEVKS